MISPKIKLARTNELIDFCLSLSRLNKRIGKIRKGMILPKSSNPLDKLVVQTKPKTANQNGMFISQKLEFEKRLLKLNRRDFEIKTS